MAPGADLRPERSPRQAPMDSAPTSPKNRRRPTGSRDANRARVPGFNPLAVKKPVAAPGKQLDLHRIEPRLAHPVEEVRAVDPGVAVGGEPLLTECGVLPPVCFRGAGGAGDAVGVDHREPLPLEAAGDLGERQAVLAHVGQGVVAEDEVEARVGEREHRRARRHEPARGAEAPVMAPAPHVDGDAARRREQVAADDVIGAEPGRTDFQHPVSGLELRADTVSDEVVQCPRARLCAAMGAAPDARGDAVGLEACHRLRADPAGCIGDVGEAARSRSNGRTSIRAARELHVTSSIAARGPGIRSARDPMRAPAVQRPRSACGSRRVLVPGTGRVRPPGEVEIPGVVSRCRPNCCFNATVRPPLSQNS